MQIQLLKHAFYAFNFMQLYQRINYHFTHLDCWERSRSIHQSLSELSYYKENGPSKPDWFIKRIERFHEFLFLSYGFFLPAGMPQLGD